MNPATCSVTCSDIIAWCSQYDVPPFHGVFCDPPYGLSFMGKGWDHSVPGVDYWKAISSVCYPGAYLMAFGGTRTFHRLACAIEDAGFELRDTLMWVYGSGFPKSLDVGKAIDKEAGAEREVEGVKPGHEGFAGRENMSSVQGLVNGALGGDGGFARPWMSDPVAVERYHMATAPATPAAKQWNGYGTALKPAYEPIILARKPIEGTVAENVQRYGCGGINIDGCRVAGSNAGGHWTHKREIGDGNIYGGGGETKEDFGNTNPSSLGRWPANLIHDGSQQVMELFPNTGVSSGGGGSKKCGVGGGSIYGTYGLRNLPANIGLGDSGSAARFFYCAKASRSERGEGNNHPTVKPIELCKYLSKLILPPIEESRLLVPFAGSGSECVAASLSGWNQVIGVEREQAYVDIATHRISHQ